MKVVYAVDVRTSAVDIAGITTTNQCAVKSILPPRGAVVGGSISAEWQRTMAVTKEVAESLHKHEILAVCMTRPLWNTPAKDATAHRRAGLWWAIAGELLQASVPVIEIPAMLSLAWAANGTGNAPTGAGTLDRLAEYANRYYPEAKPLRDEYRRGTVITAAMAAQALGVEVSLPVTAERLSILSGSKSVRWSKRLPAIPRTAAEWERRHTALVKDTTT